MNYIGKLLHPYRENDLGFREMRTGSRELEDRESNLIRNLLKNKKDSKREKEKRRWKSTRHKER